MNSWGKNITANKRVVIQFLHRPTGSIQSDIRTTSSISITVPLLEPRPRASSPLALNAVKLLNWLLTPGWNPQFTMHHHRYALEATMLLKANLNILWAFEKHSAFHHSQSFAPEKSPDGGPCLLPKLFCLRPYLGLTVLLLPLLSWPISHLSGKCYSAQALCTCVLSYFSHVWLIAILWAIDQQAPLSRQEY